MPSGAVHPIILRSTGEASASRRMGRPSDLGFTRDRHHLCASRV